MEKSSYAMAKFSLEPKEPMPKRDCGFYIKYIFLFTSLIQFLIILGLVLFMVYGNAQGGTDTHLRVLEEQLDLLKHECGSLRSDMSYTFQRIRDMLSPYSCSTVHEQLNWLTQRTEGLFLWQQERETKYVGKSVCDMNLLQCRINCSEEKQELEKRLQDVQKQVKGGQEEKQKLLVEKERLGKELEEKSKAAVQAGQLREQLSLCMGSKLDAFFDLTGSRVPLGSGRSSPFVNTGSYADALQNQGIFGNMGKINAEEIQRTVQKIMEQYTATLKNPSG